MSFWQAFRHSASSQSRILGAIVLLVVAVSVGGARTGHARSTETSKRVDFIGFSQDEDLAAYRLHITRQATPKWRDHYQLIRVVDTRTHQTLTQYKASRIVRRDLKGNTAARSRLKLAQNNPDFSKTRPQREWKALNKARRFRRDGVGANTIPLRVIADPGSEIQSLKQGSDLQLSAVLGKGLGFTLSLDDGTQAVLGRFRHEAPLTNGRIEAQVRFSLSPSGRYLALVTTFETITNHRATQPLCFGKIVTRSSNNRYRPTHYAALPQQEQVPGYYKELSLALVSQLDHNARIFP
jgi:hypothetical protein